VALTVSDAEYSLNSALHNWACVDSPLRVAAMKKAEGYLNRPIAFTVEISMAEESRVNDFVKSFEALSEDLVELKKIKDQFLKRINLHSIFYLYDKVYTNSSNIKDLTNDIKDLMNYINQKEIQYYNLN
jgi:hypothetical protein